MADHPGFAIIIPHYNDHARLERCLTALLRNDLTGAEVVVADNRSDPPLDALAAQFPTVRFVTEPTRGAAAARNRGVAETTAPLLFFLDADCVPAPDWVATALRVSRPDTVIGGRIDVFDEGTGPRSGAQAFETVFAFNQRAYVRDKGFSVTANLLTTRAVFQAVGPFVVGLSEDVEWCQRATAAGFDLIYEDRLVVAHPSRGDWPALSKKWRRMTDEAFGSAGHDIAGRLRWAGKALLMPISILVHLPRVLRHPALRDGRERLRCAAVLVRLRLTRAGWMLRQAAGQGTR
ncbi:glycosyltransferase family 2 protein [Actibacterium ureilyticum]|uniref:glycosyltransferase family 2 protein n=1 Tax=Actibacterium ureilyticum TaxID=1590614 RepID=UPI000BAA9D61|nr:glycosyltransferase [Actibacterium ureilyticum]